MNGEAAKYNVVVSQSIMGEHGDHKKVAVWRGKSRFMWSMVNSQKTLFTDRAPQTAVRGVFRGVSV